MENNLRKGDLVSYYDGGYTGRIINEDGEMDIWDWHLYSSGRILTVYKKQALVFLYSNIDEEPRPPERIFLNEVSTAWISIQRLIKVPIKK